MVLVSKDSHPKRLQTGQYDDKILCADCDNKFAPWEDDTADLLVRAGAYDQFRQAKPGENFYTIQDYDYASALSHSNRGYSLFSFTRASAVVNCQSALV